MLQLHFHWGADNSRGSEHTINGEEFPMEMHIVHIKRGLTIEQALAAPDGLAVVGQMFEVATSSSIPLLPDHRRRQPCHPAARGKPQADQGLQGRVRHG